MALNLLLMTLHLYNNPNLIPAILALAYYLLPYLINSRIYPSNLATTFSYLSISSSIRSILRFMSCSVLSNFNYSSSGADITLGGG